MYTPASLALAFSSYPPWSWPSAPTLPGLDLQLPHPPWPWPSAPTPSLALAFSSHTLPGLGLQLPHTPWPWPSAPTPSLALALSSYHPWPWPIIRPVHLSHLICGTLCCTCTWVAMYHDRMPKGLPLRSSPNRLPLRSSPNGGCPSHPRVYPVD